MWARARSELRRRWATTLVLALMVALASGAVLSALAGARRTASAYDRFLDRTDASDALVNPDSGQADFTRLATLPGVERVAVAGGMPILPLPIEGEPDLMSLAPLSDVAIGYDVDRPLPRAGRLPGRDAPDEVFVSTLMASRFGLDVGDELRVGAFELSEEAEEGVRQTEEFVLRVVGVGTVSDAVQDEANTTPVMLLSPAYLLAHPDQQPSYAGARVTLADGADPDTFAAAVQEVIGQKVYVQLERQTTADAEAAIQPYVAALVVFAGAAALGSLVIVGQALARQVRVDSTEQTLLGALGMRRSQVAAAATVRGGVVAVVGAALGVAVATVTSAWTPLGVARAVEPDRGIAFDAVVLPAGAAVTLALVLAGVAWSAARATRRAAPQPVGTPTAPSTVAVATQRLALPPTAAAGVAMALEGRRTGAVPVATTITGAVAGVGALAAALTFGAGLDRLLTTPALYGWDWDVGVDLDGIQADRQAGELASLASVSGVADGTFGQVAVNGVAVPAVGLDPDHGTEAVHPPVTEGRWAAGADEIVLGAETLRRIGRDVGDRVDVAVGHSVVSARIVGRAVFPRFAAYPGADKTGLGVGAAMTTAGLAAISPPEEQSFAFALVRFDRGGDREAAEAELRALLPGGGIDVGGYDMVHGPTRPDDLAGWAKVNRTPMALAALLAGLAGASTAHGLVVAVRRRRRELAVLRTLGFSRSQVRRTVAWQASAVAVVALAAGLPLGIATGRWTWAALADRMGAAAAPVTPLAVLALVAAATVALTNAMAAVPARWAATANPATVLRAE